MLRQQKERNAQLQFAAAMRACEEAAFQLQEASDQLAAGWSSLCEELSQGITATRLVRTQSWCNLLEARQKDRSTALQDARRAMNVAWREMMLSTRDREALDRYHDKCRRLFDREMQRQEQKHLDEFGIRRATVRGLVDGAHQFGKDRL